MISNAKTIDHYLHDSDLANFFPKNYHQQLQVVIYDKGQTICSQGDYLDYIAYFFSGKAKVIRQSANGKEHILETLDQATIIGDIELMTQKPAVSSVIALEKCTLVQLPLFDKTELLSDPLFLYQVGREIAQKCYQQNISSSANITYSVKERLASHILEVEKDGQFSLELTLLADAFGTSYRHLGRVIKKMMTNKVIAKTAFKQYRIIDKQTLNKLAIQE
ncbi:Crp/Fnr family transcriptional regulator [Streptococcus agalactiae LMG 14747]|uniref:Crp/Fnr family transcriptional regulator n=2 Tax=Streptococcus TaxID=1301 RepID=V6Z5N9_STRAG|nr:cyclic nucleotide-binding domain-containing protein [Streptococcus acidominimus]ESV55596.1 Crp/Fnr family transcriptional regulator [Streptococcus agalactiae LMG 14747]SNV32649.1 Crp family regulatory protein [Streptococcus acidominimus]